MDHDKDNDEVEELLLEDIISDYINKYLITEMILCDLLICQGI